MNDETPVKRYKDPYLTFIVPGGDQEAVVEAVVADEEPPNIKVRLKVRKNATAAGRGTVEGGDDEQKAG